MLAVVAASWNEANNQQTFSFPEIYDAEGGGETDHLYEQTHGDTTPSHSTETIFRPENYIDSVEP